MNQDDTPQDPASVDIPPFASSSNSSAPSGASSVPASPVQPLSSQTEPLSDQQPHVQDPQMPQQTPLSTGVHTPGITPADAQASVMPPASPGIPPVTDQPQEIATPVQEKRHPFVFIGAAFVIVFALFALLGLFIVRNPVSNGTNAQTPKSQYQNVVRQDGTTPRPQPRKPTQTRKPTLAPQQTTDETDVSTLNMESPDSDFQKIDSNILDL